MSEFLDVFPGELAPRDIAWARSAPAHAERFVRYWEGLGRLEGESCRRIVRRIGVETALFERRVVSAAGRKGSKVGRNDPCPCGSGKKFKRCCLAE